MLEDAARFQELQAKKDEERRHFQTALDKIKADHLNKVAAEEEQHRKEMEVKRTQIEQQEREIAQIQRENKEIMDQITKDAKQERKDIKAKNRINLKQVTDMTLKVNADLMLKEGKKKDEDKAVSTAKRSIQDKDSQIKQADDQIKKLNEEIDRNNKLIDTKDKSIGDKEKRIYTLKR